MTGLIVIVALVATALVGLDLALRPQRHVRASADRVERGRAVPLEGLSHKFFPGLENARAYRAIGVTIIAAAAVLAWVVLR